MKVKCSSRMQSLKHRVEFVRCAIQIKRVCRADVDMNFAAKITADRWPLLRHAIGDVVMLLPICHHRRIDISRVVVEHRFRPTALTARRKYPIERTDLAAVMSEDIFQLRQLLEGRHYFSLVANDRIGRAVWLAIGVRMRAHRRSIPVKS